MSLAFETWAPHLFVAHCRGLAMNTGIVYDGRHATLIDPALFPDEIDDIAAFCNDNDLHADTIVLTHHHWDHVLGAARFTTARVVAQQSYVAQTALELEDTRNSIDRFFAAQGVAWAAPFEPPVPDQMVEQIIGLIVGDVRIQLFHTPGHARDHLSVYDPDSCFLWAGDLLSDREIPFVSDRLDAYERTLGMLAAMDIRALVPGHGSVTRDVAEIHRRIDADRAYLADLRAMVQNAVDAGRSMDATVDACMDMVFESPDDNRGYHIMNVEQAFVELGGHVAAGTAVGWARES